MVLKVIHLETVCTETVSIYSVHIKDRDLRRQHEGLSPTQIESQLPLYIQSMKPIIISIWVQLWKIKVRPKEKTINLVSFSFSSNSSVFLLKRPSALQGRSSTLILVSKGREEERSQNGQTCVFSITANASALAEESETSNKALRACYAIFWPSSRLTFVFCHLANST